MRDDVYHGGYDCDGCGGRIYEQESEPVRAYPHCGGAVTRPDGAAIYHMYHLRINPSTGALDVSECLIV
ncbi:exonuclease VII [Paenibacillus popilliae ATCC 14706]|uniref:Exonuclease VII n=1 Tax=Paenibacillus popilliae ATCC 14706 TaxID=1212764 RepID=M9M6V7_PAEPP|nr:exonuclease VII [Paenibacillus popilliae ATCC 14706]